VGAGAYVDAAATLPLTMTKPVAFLVLLAASLPAQGLPPVGPTIGSVAWIGHREPQVGGTNLGYQSLDAYCAWADSRPATFGTTAVGIGGTIYWTSVSSDPLGANGVFYPAGDDIVVGFGVGPYNAGDSFGAPWAAQGHDLVMLDQHAIVVPPQFVYPFLGSDAWVVALPVPIDPLLVGTVWAAQAFRVDPGNGALYVSDMVAVEVQS
jgi:hypothetical protein